MNELDSLHPEFHQAVRWIDGTLAACDAWSEVRAELLRLASENFMLNRITIAPFKEELEGERMHVAGLTTRCQRVEAELAALKARIAAASSVTLGECMPGVVAISHVDPHTVDTLRGKSVRLLVED